MKEYAEHIFVFVGAATAAPPPDHHNTLRTPAIWDCAGDGNSLMGGCANDVLFAQ